MTKIYKSVSFSDLESQGVTFDIDKRICDSAEDDVGAFTYHIGQVYYKDNKIPVERLEKALWLLGVKVTAGWEVSEEVTHRTLRGDAYTGHRIVGLERGDNKWLESGMASDEAKLSSSKMRDMVQQVRGLS